MGFLGILFSIFICYLFSTSRKHIDWKLVIVGISLQLILAFLVLGLPAYGIPGILGPFFSLLAQGVSQILRISLTANELLFGPLADSEKFGFIFVLEVVPSIIFVSALMGVFYYWGIMQKILKSIGFLLQKAMKVSSAEVLAMVGNVFMGQTEACLLIRPYLNKMTRSELLCLMIGGLATVSGGILVAYVQVLKDLVPNIAQHLITASVMSAPAALLISKILLPELEKPETVSIKKMELKSEAHNTFEAIVVSTREGLSLAFNVIAMLISFIAIVFLFNSFLGWVGDIILFPEWGSFLALDDKPVSLSLDLIVAWIFAPLTFLMGIPFEEALIAGTLMGQKIITNEFVAYLKLAEFKDSLSPRSMIILSYALCGFANFTSIGILVGGLGGLVPERQKDIAQLGLVALLGGVLATFMTAAIVSLFL